MRLYEIQGTNLKTLEEEVYFVLAANTIGAINKLNKEQPDFEEEVITILASDKKKERYPVLIHKQ